jgi:hypothetical protein
MAAFSWGTEALMLGSLMMFASGVFASRPNSASASSIFCSSVSLSGKFAMIRPASEMSRVSTSTPSGAVNAFRIGRSDLVANAGASSVLV